MCFLATSCAPVLLYKGPARDPDRVARISARAGTRIVAVDGTPVPDTGLVVYDIEPGMHEMVVSMKDDGSLPPPLRRSNTKPPPICIALREGHSYEVSVAVRGARLRRSVYDLVTGFEIGTLCIDDFGDDADPNIDWPWPVQLDLEPGYESRAEGREDGGPIAWDRRTRR
jgi:hypothetical protein